MLGTLKALMLLLAAGSPTSSPIKECYDGRAYLNFNGTSSYAIDYLSHSSNITRTMKLEEIECSPQGFDKLAIRLHFADATVMIMRFKPWSDGYYVDKIIAEHVLEDGTVQPCVIRAPNVAFYGLDYNSSQPLSWNCEPMYLDLFRPPRVGRIEFTVDNLEIELCNQDITKHFRYHYE